MDVLTNTLIAGAAYVIAGFLGLVRHFMLEPKGDAIPKAPVWLLHVFFAFSAILCYVGLRFLWSWADGTATTSPPGATGMGVLMALALLIYKGSLLKDAYDQFSMAGTIWRHS